MVARLLSHPSTFFGTIAACFCALFAMVNIVVLTFFGARIADVGTQITELLCKLAIH
jgi:hypothetical protein